LQQAAATAARNELTATAESAGDYRIYSGVLEKTQADTLKNIAHQIRQSDDGSIVIIGSEYDGKVSLVVSIGDRAAGLTGLNAVEMIKTVSGEISGGGGGQPQLATAGGKRAEGLPAAISKAVSLAKKML